MERLPTIPELIRRQKQEEHKFRTNLGYSEF